ncbi:NAD(P)-binding domain-containing protein [Geodermatophilus sp. SYSU D01176]
MRVAVLGSGQVGRALARGWTAHGHGGIEASRWLEAMCMAWVVHGARTGTWGHAFELLR